MFAKMVILLMTIGLLLGCSPAEDDAPEEDNQPVDEQIEEDMDNMGEETEDMFEEDEIDPGMDDTDQPEYTEEEPAAPEEDEE